MVAAGTAHGDRADDHQLVQVLGVGEFGNRWLVHITAAEDLVHIHLGHTASRGAGVVIVGGVDDHGVEHRLHLLLDLVQHQLQLAGLNKIGDVVVGVKTLVRRLQALADLDRNGRALFSLFVFIHIGEFSEHSRMVPANQLPKASKALPFKRRFTKRRKLWFQ